MKKNMINIEMLNKWQSSHKIHPFTCGSGNRTDKHHLDGDGVLLATEAGWKCPYCHFTQDYRDFEQYLSVNNPETTPSYVAMYSLMNARP